MDPDEYRQLHETIERGDSRKVRDLVQTHAEGHYFLYGGQSALYKAFHCKEYEIATFLIHKGARMTDSEVSDLKFLGRDLTCVNNLLTDYNRKSEKSCIDQLMSWSQSPQSLDGEHRNAVMSMYEDFFRSEIIKLLMKVLENEVFNIVFDFESEVVNKIRFVETEKYVVYGLTVPKSKEISIGAKNLLSGDTKKRVVYGVVAEELCHLALLTVFENCAKPYTEEHTELSREFRSIVEVVKSLSCHSRNIESVVKNVFTSYPKSQWECELIARVPHLVGIYGEEIGRRILTESTELSRLLNYFEQHVIPKCKEYTNPFLNTRRHQMLGQLMRRSDLIAFNEKRVRPLKNGFPSFREFLVKRDYCPASSSKQSLVVKKSFSVITTNCTKLCTLQVYHELRKEIGDLLEKQCLFFAWRCLQMIRDEILDALKGIVCKYLIIVLDKKKFNLQRFTTDWLNYLDDRITTDMKVILITDPQSFPHEFQNKALNYKWDDLTDEYKVLHERVTYSLKGNEEVDCVSKDDFREVFNDEEIMRIINGEIIDVFDGAALSCESYVPETYVERTFMATTLDRKIIENLPPDTCVFISGLSRKESQELFRDEQVVQWLNEPDDEILDDKLIFIINNERPMTFKHFRGKSPKKINILIYHEEKVFYLRNPDSLGDIFSEHKKHITINEEGMLVLAQKKRVVIISDDAGCGKSTVTCSLLSRVNSMTGYLAWRIDFSKFSSKEDPLSLACIEDNSPKQEVVLDHFFLMLGIKIGLEKHLFLKFCNSGRCFIYFDAFDEIPSKYKPKALALISSVREKTKINIIITTRRHQQEELEEMLNTYSHQLVPFHNLAQVTYLEKFWKWKLKYPNGTGMHSSRKDKKDISKKIGNIIVELRKEMTKLDAEYVDLRIALENIEMEKCLDSVRSEIENIDFMKIAKHVIDKSLVNKDSLEFMGIPLHLYMIGIVHFNDCFSVEIQSDIYSLYWQFIEKKILIYLEEKEKMRKEGNLKERTVKRTREDVFRTHTKIAIQLIDDGKVCFATEMDKDDLDLCTDLGVVNVHGGKICFLHQTFAEFFKAESVRQNIQKEKLLKVLLDHKNTVVRRFLTSSLKNKNFEKLTEEFFEKDFFINIMEGVDFFLRRCEGLNYNSDELCCVKIMKKLLVNFEQIVESGLVNKFIEEVESRLVLSSLTCVGGCLTVPMIKNLIHGNFMVKSKILFSFVRFSESINEVNDVLIECISVGSDGGTSQIEFNETEMKKAEIKCLVELLRLQDSQGRSLLYYALWNENAEIFARLLILFRDCLGKEQFMKDIIKSNEYRTEIPKFIDEVHASRTCSFIKALHSAFENEMEVLFNNYRKMRVVKNALYYDEKDVLSNSFEKVISVFQECFDGDQLKKFFLSRCSDGDCLVHILITSSSGKNVIKHLKVIKNILVDNDMMIQFLKSEDNECDNIFHAAAYKMDEYLEDLFKFCEPYLGKDAIIDMLLSNDKDGDQVIHLLFTFNSTETLTKNLNLIKDTVGDELFKQMLQSKDSRSRNILHSAALRKDKYLDVIIQFCDPYLGKEGIKAMLLSNDEDGDDVIHLLFKFNSYHTLMKNLNLIKETVGDESFKQMLKSKDRHNMNIFHFAAENKNKIDLSFIDMHLCVSEILYLLMERNEDGWTCLHSATYKHGNVQFFIDCAYALLRCDKSRFEEFILVKTKKGNTFLHLLNKYYNKFEFVPKIISLLKEKLSEAVFEKFLSTTNKEGKTFQQMDKRRRNSSSLQEFLQKN